MAYKTLLRTVFIVLLTAGWGGKAFAQKDIPFSFDTFRHVVADVCFNRVKVIDNRADKASLGYVRKSGLAADKPRHLVMKDDFSEGLEEYILRLVRNRRQQDHELLLVVYDMYAEDEPVVGNNIVTFYFRTDIFLGIGDKYYLLKAVDSLYELSTDQDASLLVQRTIGNTITDVIGTLTPIDETTIRDKYSLTIQDAAGRVAEQKKKWPIYNEQPKSGVYTSYEQLMKNEPLDIRVMVDIIPINGAQNKTIFARKNDKGKKGEDMNPADYYAVNADGKWYFSQGNKLVRMIFEHGDFYTEDIRMGIYKRTKIAGPDGAVAAIDDAVTGKRREGNYKVRLDVMRNGELVPVKRITKLL